MSGQRDQVRIADLMAQSGVRFGTSGARGLAAEMTDRVCYAYTRAFLQYLESIGEMIAGSRVAFAGDYRPSTGRIMAAVAMAIRDLGHEPVNCGHIPTPALALYGIQQGIPGLMVTGSHIPKDRNGIKFNKPGGEILKQDEAAICAREVWIPAGRFAAHGNIPVPVPLPPESADACRTYVQRYLDFFPADCLRGRRIGLYEHSGVARRALGEILEGLGAEVTRLGRSDTFIPVDTEAVRQEDIALAREWALTYGFDSIISADGDGDRPLVSDEHGHWLRGDVAGILCARYLGVDRVVTPVSSNSAVEKCGWFGRVERTRIGSPYVIEVMNRALDDGACPVVGYEANGGFLIAGDIERNGRILHTLPTRDAAIVPLAILMLATSSGHSVSALLRQLPQCFTSSGRLRNFPTELSHNHIAILTGKDPDSAGDAIEALFGESFGRAGSIDITDGLRITFEGGEVVHLRPSGNAPELRYYTEAGSEQRAVEMGRICAALLEEWRQ